MTRINPIILLLFFIINPVLASTDSLATDPVLVNHLNIHGNRVTKEKIIKLYLDIDTGDYVTTDILQNAKQRLMKSGLFTKVALFTLKNESGTHLHVILTERFYLNPDAGGGYFQYKYGEKEFWLRLNCSIEYKNFRGVGEKLKISTGIWDWRNVSLSWSKTFLPSSFYVLAGVNWDLHPNQSRRINHTEYSGKFILGREFFKRSKIGAGLFPIMEIRDSLDTDQQIRTKEIFVLAGWEIDNRKQPFNPSRGWYFYSDLRSNHLYNFNTPPYLQLNSEFKLYHRGFFADNTIAWRIATTFRNHDGGPTHYQGLGGNKTVRGYPQPMIGNGINGNNTLLLSAEYRFPLFRLPLLSVPLLTSVNSRFDQLDIRVHGALIGDFGRVAETSSDLLSYTSSVVESGTGLGAGIRILAPDLETNGCIDLVFAEDIRSPRQKIQFYSRPTLHVYLNFPY